MDKLNIPIILGTARKERRSENVANYVLEKAKEYGFDSQIVDVREYMLDQTIPPWQNQSEVKTWNDIADKADGYIIVTPEYNHGYPGELKILLDQAFDEYKKKPVSICGVSTGQFGGSRVIEALWNVLIELWMVPTSISVNFGNIKELFDADGNITNKKFDKYVNKMFKETEWYAKTLRDGKSNHGE